MLYCASRFFRPVSSFCLSRSTSAPCECWATVTIVLQNCSMAGLQDWRRRNRVKRVLMLGAAVITAIATSQVRAATQSVTAFAALIEQLSESNGDFDTDNLISNESSYLHV